jgi:hypothetical protein
MSLPLLKLDWATHEAAKFAVEHWHYSKQMPVGKCVKVGVWEAGAFIGVVTFNQGANRNIGSPYGLGLTEACELTRVALTKHVTPVSRIVAIAIRFLTKQSPGLKLIVSYADPGHGHHGGIYQAGNWVYVGFGCATRHLLIDGSPMHNRMAFDLFGSSSANVVRAQTKVEVIRLPPSPKHTYLMPLDPTIRTFCEALRKPYPKRVKQAMPGDHSDSGGATPTHPLQNTGETA